MHTVDGISNALLTLSISFNERLFSFFILKRILMSRFRFPIRCGNEKGKIRPKTHKHTNTHTQRRRNGKKKPKVLHLHIKELSLSIIRFGNEFNYSICLTHNDQLFPDSRSLSRFALLNSHCNSLLLSPAPSVSMSLSPFSSSTLIENTSLDLLLKKIE